MWLIKKPSYPCFMKIEKKQKQNKKTQANLPKLLLLRAIWGAQRVLCS